MFELFDTFRNEASLKPDVAFAATNCLTAFARLKENAQMRRATLIGYSRQQHTLINQS